MGIACGEGPVTEIVLVVDTPLEPPFELDRIVIRTTSPSGQVESFPAVLDGSGDALDLPLSLVLVAGGSALEPVRVDVDAYWLAAPTFHRQSVVTGFVRGETRLLHVILWPACVDDPCPGQQCDRTGACLPADVAGRSLPRFTGLPPRPPDPCIPPSGNPVETVGCNGDILGPAPYGPEALFGACDPATIDGQFCRDGSECLRTSPTHSICLPFCRAATSGYVSRGSDPACPWGSRCFNWGDGLSSCFPDCLRPEDCVTGFCDPEGSCFPPDPSAVPDAGGG
jgi:hypothetical protein